MEQKIIEPNKVPVKVLEGKQEPNNNETIKALNKEEEKKKPK